MQSPASTHSDDSQLVIDEPPMEIDDSHSDGTDDLFESFTESAAKPIPEEVSAPPKTVPLPTREITPQRAEIPVAVVAPSSSNKEKPASSKPGPKRVAHTHCYKLTELIKNDSNSLCISANPSQFYNMRMFMMPDTLLAAEFSRQTDPPPETSIISIGQLLNWPDVRVTIIFRDLTLSRVVRSNAEHDLVFGDDPYINLDSKPNVMEPRMSSAVVSSKSNPMAYTPILMTYFNAIIDAATIADMSRARRNEIELVYGKFQKDFEKLNVIETKKDYSQFLMPNKYVRLFDNDPKYNKATAHGLKVRLRETINPEVLFSVDKCKFDIDRMNYWEDEVMKYLDNLLVKQDKFHLEALVDMLKKCIIVSCTICNKTFEGILCIVSIKGHLWEHYNKAEWTCVRCKKSFSTFELTGANNWSHNCLLMNGTSP